MDHTECGHSLLLTYLSCVVVPDLSLVHLVGEREAVAPLHLPRELLQALQERHHRGVELKEEKRIQTDLLGDEIKLQLRSLVG